MTKINGIVYSDDMKTIEKCDITLSGTVVIPEGVEHIKARAFAWSNITSVKFPNSLKYIGERAFAESRYLDSVDFGKSKYNILYEKDIFYNCSIKHLVIPRNIKTIGLGCFRMCPIESVSFEEGVELIGNEVFWPATRLKEIKLPDSLKIIEPSNFINLKVVHSNSYCQGISSICMNSYKLIEYTSKHGTIYIPGPVGYFKFNYIRTMLDDYMKGKIKNVSYIDMINNLEVPSLKFIQAAEIYDKTHDSQVLHFLKENNTEVKNYLLESENVILLSKLISSNVFSKKQLVDILHNEICNSSIPLKAIVLDKLKKQSFESSKFNI